jgi:hypothetical protein
MKFQDGQTVVIRFSNTRQHHRVPRYAMGRLCQVVCFVGLYPDPTQLAHTDVAFDRELYRVRIDSKNLSISSKHEAQAIELEVYDNWLTEPGST